jgi:hypothetical protein
MKAIIGLTAAYAIAVAIVFAGFVISSPSSISNIALAEAAFALLMMIACFLALIIRSVIARRVLLVFEIGFSILSLLILVSTFTGEHDAQYQLAVLAIPLMGFPAVAIPGVIAALSPRSRAQ